MQAVIQSPLNESLCAPLTTGRHIGDCLVANMPLKELMATELRRAGFELLEESEAGDLTVHLPLDHWVDVGALCMLARETSGTAMFDQRGDVVAWKGRNTADECDKRMVTEAASFRIKYPWEFLKLNADVLNAMPASSPKGKISPLAHIDGSLHLGEGSAILPGVVIEGNVVIGENCKIGPNAYIRGNTSIGNNCRIGNAVEIKNSVIYHNTMISHLSFVGDSVIGSHVTLGAGTIVSNFRHDGKNHRSMAGGRLIDTHLEKFGTIIGDGVRTGANTVIYPGRKIGRARTTLPCAIVTKDLM